MGLRHVLLLLLIWTSNHATGQYDQHTIALDTTLTETQLGQPKHLKVITPDGFDMASTVKYPLYIVFDMQNALNFDMIVRNIDYLSAFGQIPTGVIVGIDALPNQGRYFETQLIENHPKALGKENADFVFETVIPLVQNSFNATLGNILIGHSRYGYFTTHLLCEYPEDLIGVISLSPFFVQKNTDHTMRLPDSLRTARLQHDLYYVAAVGDTFVDTGDYFNMIAALDAADLPDRFHYRGLEYPLGDHYTLPGMSIGTALYTIFEQWYQIQLQYYRSQTNDLHGLHAELQDSIEVIYGAQLPFSLGNYNGVGWRYYSEENKESALASWELLGEYYPQFSYAWLFAAETAFELGDLEKYRAMLDHARNSTQYNTILTREELEEVEVEIKRISSLDE